MTDKVEPVRKVSPFLLVMVLIVFILSLSALFMAVQSIVDETDIYSSYSFLAIGFVGLALSAYMLLQTRGRPSHMSLELPRVLTTLECPKCDYKSIRDFQREDYIFKETGPCEKCEENMKITAIYREAKKKK